MRNLDRLRPMLWIVPLYVIGPLVVWFWAAQARGLWPDETLTFIQTQRPIVDVVMVQARGFHPPAYHLGVHEWTLVFGAAPLALRTYSMAWAFVFVGSAYLFAKELYGPRVAAITALVLPYVPFVTWYATDARMYVQMLALGTLASWILLRHERRQTLTWLLAYWVTASLLLLTHYFSGLIIAAHGVYFLGRQLQMRGWLRAILASIRQFAVPSAAILAWLGFVVKYGAQTLSNTPSYPKPNVYTLFDSIVSILFGYHSPDVNLRLIAAWPLALLVVVLSVGGLGRIGRRGFFLWALAGVPILILVVGSYALRESVFDPRYMSIVCVPIFIAIALLLERIPGRRNLLLALGGTLVIATSFTAQSLYLGNNPRIYDLDKAASLVAEQRLPDDAVLIAPSFVTGGWASAYSFNGLVFDSGVGTLDTKPFWRIFVSHVSDELAADRKLQTWADAQHEDLVLTKEGNQEASVASLIGYITGSLPPAPTGRIWLVTTFEHNEVNAVISAQDVVRNMAATSDLVEKWTFRQVTVRLYDVRPSPSATGGTTR